MEPYHSTWKCKCQQAECTATIEKVITDDFAPVVCLLGLNVTSIIKGDRPMWELKSMKLKESAQ